MPSVAPVAFDRTDRGWSTQLRLCNDQNMEIIIARPPKLTGTTSYTCLSSVSRWSETIAVSWRENLPSRPVLALLVRPGVHLESDSPKWIRNWSF